MCARARACVRVRVCVCLIFSSNVHNSHLCFITHSSPPAVSVASTLRYWIGAHALSLTWYLKVRTQSWMDCLPLCLISPSQAAWSVVLHNSATGKTSFELREIPSLLLNWIMVYVFDTLPRNRSPNWAVHYMHAPYFSKLSNSQTILWNCC